MNVLGCLEAIKTDDADCWDETLKEIGEYDFFHLAAFHRLAEMRGEGSAALLVYRESSYIMAFPLLLRNIDLPFLEKTDYKDATSVKGLAGPVASTADLPDDVKKRFHQHLQDYFEQNHILSVYSRLNPLMKQPALLKGYGEVVEIGVTVSIDLTPPPDVQFARYRKDHKYNIKRLQKMGFVCERAGIEGLDDFMPVYIETMNRLNADEVYYYDKSYFEYLLREMPDVMCLFICKDGEKVVSIKICAECNGIVESYLSGTTAEYLKLAPAKLINDEMRIWANEIGAKTLHLGGSVGGRRDSLYEYKMGFGGQEHVYSTWRHIVDQEKYNAFCQEAWQKAGEKLDDSYFPSYRNPFLSMAAVL